MQARMYVLTYECMREHACTYVLINGGGGDCRKGKEKIK